MREQAGKAVIGHEFGSQLACVLGGPASRDGLGCKSPGHQCLTDAFAAHGIGCCSSVADEEHPTILEGHFPKMSRDWQRPVTAYGFWV